MPWYYIEDNRSVGPITDDQLAEYFRSTKLTPESLLWREGMDTWKPAQTITPPPPGLKVVRPVHTSHPSTYDLLKIAHGKHNPPPKLNLSFTGSWLAYYKVWLIGMILTVFSLGLYSPWAKIRNKRYLYAHTKIGNDCLDYQANPWRILVGRLLIAGLFSLYLVTDYIHPILPKILLGLGVLALPYVMTQSLRFNARATVWRGIPFKFSGNVCGFLLSHALFLIPPLWPVAICFRRRWLINNLSYGNTSFSYKCAPLGLYAIYLRSAIFFIPAGLCYLGFGLMYYSYYVGSQQAPIMIPAWVPFWVFSILANASFVGPAMLPFMIPIALGGFDFIRARVFTFHWNQTTVGEHAIHAYMAPWEAFKVRMLNSAATLFSFGLLWPAVKIHNHRFNLDCLNFAPASDLDDLKAAQTPSRTSGSLGEAASDFLNLEIGL